MATTRTDNDSAVPKTKRGQASRERLLDAAVASVLERGIHQMRVDEVLATAGSSKSQLYHYFSDRDGLVEAVVARRCDEYVTQLGQALESVNSLEDLGRVLSQFAASYASSLGGCPIGTLASELTSGPEPARRVTVEAFGAWEGFLAQALARAQAAGDLTPSAHPDGLALEILAALEGGMFLSQVREDMRPLEAALGAVMARLEGLRA